MIKTTDEKIRVLTRDGRFIEVPPEDSLGVTPVTSWSDWGLCTGYHLRGKVPARKAGRIIIVNESVLQFTGMRDDFVTVCKSDGWFRRSWLKNAVLPKIPGKRAKACVKDVSFHVRL